MSETKFERKPNSVSVFVNNRRANEKSPILGGTICIDVEMVNRLANGKPTVEMDLSLWARESKAGVKYWSGSISEMYRYQNINTTSDIDTPPAMASDPKPTGEDTFNNDLPF